MEKERVLKGDKLIHGYTLELIEPPCSPGAKEWTAKAHLEDNIAGLLPYLNAEFMKALKIPFAVKVGKLNMQKVYLGNTMTAFLQRLLPFSGITPCLQIAEIISVY
ncbi:MAG: hypothetical protein K0B01_05735 [Syntrophobacterales bacterium]|nr:hypothetical protein [Syntrophobacterales bacterium]